MKECLVVLVTMVACGYPSLPPLPDMNPDAPPVPLAVCGAGTEQAASGTPTSTPVCVACAAGTYCAGGTAPSQPCSTGTWDHDGNPATACVAWTSCVPGQAVATSGTATKDRTCATCASGKFSTTMNAASCTPWTNCQPGTYVSAKGTSASDRQCAACMSCSSSTVVNASSCTVDPCCGSTDPCCINPTQCCVNPDPCICSGICG